jgi:hypothetical protein
VTERGCKTLAAVSSQRSGRSWGQPDPGDAGEGGKQPRQRRDAPVLPDGVGPASETGRWTRGTSGVKPLKTSASSNPVDPGWIAVRTRPLIAGRGTPGSDRSCRPGGHGEGLRRSRGDAAGAKLATSPDDRFTVNVGTARGSRSRPACQVGRSGKRVVC